MAQDNMKQNDRPGFSRFRPSNREEMIIHPKKDQDSIFTGYGR